MNGAEKAKGAEMECDMPREIKATWKAVMEKRNTEFIHFVCWSCGPRPI